MKKILSVVLSAALLLSVFGVGASAVVDHSLQFNPPMIEDIEVSWNGDILLGSRWADSYSQQVLAPVFSPQNLDVTVFFDDGTSEVLEHWYGEFWVTGNSFWWEVRFVYNLDANNVAVRLFCSRLRDAALQEDDFDWTTFYATLPNDTIENIPENFVDEFLAQQSPAMEIALGKSTTFTGMRVLTFTVPETRRYGLGWLENRGSLLVFNAQHEVKVDTWGGFTAEFQANNVYYVVATPQNEDRALVMLLNASEPQPWQPTLYQRWLNWLDDMSWRLSRNALGRILIIFAVPFVVVISLVLLPISWVIHGWWF
ncbi:MAG: hypothetical protein FWD06_00390 [Oscillospiraceae bacterium]|nr:hypothetical protein [Oscillospiraceae bacterium]